MQSMFAYAAAFNQPLAFDTANLAFAQTSSMFRGATAFNQDLCLFGHNFTCSADMFTTNSGLRTAIQEYLDQGRGQGCTNDLNCNARYAYGGAVSRFW